MEQPPIYLRIEQPEDFRATLTSIEGRIASAAALTDRLAALQAEEDRVLGSWTENLADTRARLQSLLAQLSHARAPRVPHTQHVLPAIGANTKTHKRGSDDLDELRKELSGVGSRLRKLS